MESTNRSAMAVANYLLELAEQFGSHDMTNMKLNKLVYIAYGWWAGATSKKLFKEPIEAWQWGPVVPIVYREFKHFGSRPIPSGFKAIDDWHASVAALDCCGEDAEVRQLLQYIWKSYGKLSGSKLMSKTHEKGTPWERAYTGQQNVEIDPDTIGSYYGDLLTK